MEFNIIDIIMIIVLAVFGLLGLRKGLVGNLVGLISLIASIMLAWILYPIVADMLMGIGLRDYIYNGISQRVSLSPSGGTTVFLPVFLTEMVSNGAEAATLQVTSYVTDIILNIISFLIVLIISRVIIFIGEKILNIAVRLPILNGLNRVGGLVAGLLKGVIVIYLISMIIFVVSPVMKENEAVKKSYFMNKMYNNNPIVSSIIKEEQVKFEQNGE